MKMARPTAHTSAILLEWRRTQQHQGTKVDAEVVRCEAAVRHVDHRDVDIDGLIDGSREAHAPAKPV
jgi:hypothetical protein